MSRTIKLGEGLTLNVDKLVETRLLAQANSGGGKSMLLRKLLEESHGMVQQIVLDMEGEFSTLRERHDFILAGKGGDIPTDPRSAALLARKILELQTSLIVDLYDLKPFDQALFVKNFLDALMAAPKELWHPVLVVIDEAHKFVPEKGESQAAAAVVDLATRGRKRGFAAVLATQRLSKLHKDVAAECLNKLIGRTGLDIDMKRASEELGFASKADMLKLRGLQPGNFFAFGPAISDEVVQGKVGKVHTTHPEAGKRAEQKVPVPTAKVKKILSELNDLPKAAEEEARDVASLKAKVRSLEGELRQAARGKPSAELEKEIFAGGERAGRKSAEAQIRELTKLCDAMHRAGADIARLAGKMLDQGRVSKTTPSGWKTVPPSDGPIVVEFPKGVQIDRVKVVGPVRGNSDSSGRLGSSERRILKFLVLRVGKFFEKRQIGAMTHFKWSGGSFNTYLSRLASAGFIEKRGRQIGLRESALDEAIALLGDEYHSGDQAGLEAWLEKLGGGEKKVYEVILSNPDRTFSKQELAEAAGYEAGGGSFNTYVSRLSTLGLIERANDGIRLNPEVQGL